MSQSIALVVIGRNSEGSLEKIYDVVTVARLSEIFEELVYVDSASSDLSAELMRERGFNVYELDSASILSPAAGRWLGTLRTSAEFVLYIDSDMELEGIEKIPNEVDQLRRDGFDGWAGSVTDIAPTGKHRKRIRRSASDGTVFNFGGFVCLRRKSVLEVGNWNAAVFANEEIELYARLRCAGLRVRLTGEVGVLHYVDGKSTAFGQLVGLYLPWVAPRRYGAFGLALAAALRAGSAWHLARIMPEPFVLFAGLITIPATLLVGGTLAGASVAVAVVVAYEALLLRRRSWKFNFVALGIALSMPVGLWKYSPATPREAE